LAGLPSFLTTAGLGKASSSSTSSRRVLSGKEGERGEVERLRPRRRAWSAMAHGGGGFTQSGPYPCAKDDECVRARRWRARRSRMRKESGNGGSSAGAHGVRRCELPLGYFKTEKRRQARRMGEGWSRRALGQRFEGTANRRVATAHDRRCAGATRQGGQATVRPSWATRTEGERGAAWTWSTGPRARVRVCKLGRAGLRPRGENEATTR
jgi:hypothetical protein